MNIQHFADGEFAVSFEESIRGCQSLFSAIDIPNSDNLMELLLMIDAAKRASCQVYCSCCSLFGWARQDRKDKPRVSIAAKLLADILSVAGIQSPYNDGFACRSNTRFLRCSVDHLYASSVFISLYSVFEIERYGGCYPRCGWFQTSQYLCQILGCTFGFMPKQRAKANVVESMTVIGDVEGKNVILVDDMVDTAGTITKAADLMMSRGALSVRAIASHAVMSDPASERVQNSSMTELIFTDSIPYTKKMR